MLGNMRWYDKLLAPAALPAFLYLLVFKTEPNLHGIPRYLFLASKGFCIWMTVWVVLAALSWIFPFAIPEEYGYTNDQWRTVFAEDCEEELIGPDLNCSPDGRLQASGYVVFFLLLLPALAIGLPAYLFDLGFLFWLVDWSMSPAIGSLLETGHLGLWWLLSVAIFYWLVVFLPVWIALGLARLIWNQL